MTKATIRVANAVSEGAIVSAGYKPSLITYSYEAPEHRLYAAERSFDLEKTDDGRSVIDVLEYSAKSGFGHSGVEWTASTGTVSQTVQDGDQNTYAEHTSGTHVFMYSQASGRPSDFVGTSLIIDAPTGSYTLVLTVEFQKSINNVMTSVYNVKFDLDKLKDGGKVELRVIAPSPVDSAIAIAYARLNIAGTAFSRVKVYELRALQANATLLGKIARAQIKLPARELAEIDCAYGPQGENGFLLETVGKTFVAEGAPTPITGTIVEIVDTFNTEDGMRSRIALGEPVRDSTVKAIQRFVRGAT